MCGIKKGYITCIHKDDLLKKKKLKLIRSQMSFLVFFVVYLTFIRIDLSTITREHILENYFFGNVENVNYETRIEHCFHVN